MTNGSNYLLDTSIIVEIFKGNKAFGEKVYKFKNIFISTIILGELQIGIHRVNNKSKHLRLLNDFLEHCSIVIIDESTSQLYGSLVAQLFKKGTPIPTNDIWIASTALQHNFTLITKDKHFNKIEKLKVTFW